MGVSIDCTHRKHAVLVFFFLFLFYLSSSPCSAASGCRGSGSFGGVDHRDGERLPGCSFTVESERPHERRVTGADSYTDGSITAFFETLARNLFAQQGQKSNEGFDVGFHSERRF